MGGKLIAHSAQAAAMSMPQRMNSSEGFGKAGPNCSSKYGPPVMVGKGASAQLSSASRMSGWFLWCVGMCRSRHAHVAAFQVEVNSLSWTDGVWNGKFGTGCAFRNSSCHPADTTTAAIGVVCA